MPTVTIPAACLAMIVACEDADTWAAEAGSKEALLSRFALIDDVLQAVRFAHSVVGSEIMAAADDGETVPGGGTLRISPGGRRKSFDVDRLRSVVAVAIAEDMGLPADDPGVAWIVDRAWEVAPCTPSAGFRAKGAKALGINLDQFSEWEQGQRTVRIENRPHPMKENDGV